MTAPQATLDALLDDFLRAGIQHTYVMDEANEFKFVTARAAIVAHFAASAQTAAGEWVMVPRVATPEMLGAAGTMNNYEIDAGGRADDDHAEWWTTMVDLAPAQQPAAQSDGDALPPLPEPGHQADDGAVMGRDGFGWEVHACTGSAYTEEQMHAYARAAIAALRQQSPANRTAMPEGDEAAISRACKAFNGSDNDQPSAWKYCGPPAEFAKCMRAALAAYDPAKAVGRCIWPDCGHDTNCSGSEQYAKCGNGIGCPTKPAPAKAES